jgi:dipeptidyl aminopeptidase/acylaminoacyl peptidase
MVPGRLTHLVYANVEGSWHLIGQYEGKEGRSIESLGMSSDGKAFVVRALDDKGQRGLARLAIADGTQKTLFFDPKYDVVGTINDEWTDRVEGAFIVSDIYETRFFEPEYQAVQAGLAQAFPALQVILASSTLTRDKVIVQTESPRSPTAFYFLDRTTHEASKIASQYPELTEADLGEMRPYPYKARDGLDIPAYLTLPPGKPAKNLPVVVMPHGGPDARDSLGFDWWAQFLANRGYAVLQPNYRGSSGYGRPFTEAGLKQWGLKMQDDISDGVVRMIADGIADPKRICIVGGSYGGYAALAGATLTPDLYACAVSVAGISDLPEMLKREERLYGKDSWTASFWASRIGQNDGGRLAATSPARLADRVKAPILLMHGKNDTTVPIEQSELMRDALARAGKPVTFVAFDGDDHYMEFGYSRIQMLTELEKFLKANIGN